MSLNHHPPSPHQGTLRLVSAPWVRFRGWMDSPSKVPSTARFPTHPGRAFSCCCTALGIPGFDLWMELDVFYPLEVGFLELSLSLSLHRHLSRLLQGSSEKRPTWFGRAIRTNMQVKFFTNLVGEMSNLIRNRWLFTLLLIMDYCGHNQLPTCYQCYEVDSRNHRETQMLPSGNQT